MTYRWLSVAAAAALGVAAISLLTPRPIAASPRATAGSLTSPAGLCPLKHTAVRAEVSGPLARVTVTQEFENPFAEKIEAVYTLPLPHLAAVDDMTMQVGDRTIRGLIKPRDEARRIYDAARRSGRIAGLLDQERPNIFTQAVANILPGASVKIVISYVETLPYEAGSYEFRFPMVVAPRYIPLSVQDAGRIAPPVTPEGTRSGHDISVEVALDAGVPVELLQSPTHDVVIERPGTSRAVVRLRDRAVIPNKDFVLKYAVAGRRVQDAVLAHHGDRGGYFTLILQPPDRIAPAEAAPKELVFVLDTSGSMSGFPIEKAKEAMGHALNGLNPRDTFNLITFSGDTHILFPQPVPATAEHLEQARQFLASRRGSGGTEMMTAIRAALDSSDRQDHVRVVCFMTDGEVGNDFEIIGEVQRHPNARVFAFGIGSSVNHFLLDGMARYGRGEVEYVGLQDDGSAAARRFHERVRNPLLTDITIDWGGLPVDDVYPARLPDLFGAKPVVVSGRYRGAASGVVRLRGRMAGREFTREIRVDLPASEPRHDVLATLWARRRVDDLMARDMPALQRGAFPDALRREITQLGLDYRLMTQFTSFVAVEETIVTEGGVPRRVEVPVEMPEGMSYEGVFGDKRADAAMERRAGLAAFAGGVVGGIARQAPMVLNAPPPSHSVPSVRPMQKPPRKVSPAIAAVVARVRAGARPSVDESRFVFGGKAHIRLRLAGVSSSDIEQLKRLGLEVTAMNGDVVTGRVAVEKLEVLVNHPLVLSADPV